MLTGAQDWPGRDKGRIPIGWHTWTERERLAASGAAESGWLIGGPATAEFERQLAAACNARHAIALSSGSSALLSAMLAARHLLGGCEYDAIAAPLTFAATASSVILAGFGVRWADIDPASLCMSPASAERVATVGDVAAIVPVHYGGNAAAMHRLESVAGYFQIPFIIEDAAHALGAEYPDGGLVGSRPGPVAACFSFNVEKIITTGGQGGAVVTNDDDIAAAVRMVSTNGAIRDGASRRHVALGCNARMTELQAAVGVAQLGRLDRFLARRRQIARYYISELSGVDSIECPRWHVDKASWYVMPLRARRRNGLVERMRQHGIEVGTHYRSLTLQPQFRDHGYNAQFDACSYAEIAGEDIVTLPTFPTLSDAEVETVARLVRNHA